MWHTWIKIYADLACTSGVNFFRMVSGMKPATAKITSADVIELKNIAIKIQIS